MEIKEECVVRLLWRIGAEEDREWLRERCPEVVDLLSNTAISARARESGQRVATTEPLASVQQRIRNTLKAITEDLGENSWSGTPAEFLDIMAKLGEVRNAEAGPQATAQLGRALARWSADDEVTLDFQRSTALTGCRRQWVLSWSVANTEAQRSPASGDKLPPLVRQSGDTK